MGAITFNNSLFVIIITAFAAFRLTKLITSDRIFDSIRESIYLKICQKEDGNWHTGIREKIGYLLGCDLCMGIWVSLILSIAILCVYGFDNVITFIIFWMSVSGIQYKLTSVK